MVRSHPIKAPTKSWFKSSRYLFYNSSIKILLVSMTFPVKSSAKTDHLTFEVLKSSGWWGACKCPPLFMSRLKTLLSVATRICTMRQLQLSHSLNGTNDRITNSKILKTEFFFNTVALCFIISFVAWCLFSVVQKGASTVPDCHPQMVWKKSNANCRVYFDGLFRKQSQ